jgi:hypothetical protein
MVARTAVEDPESGRSECRCCGTIDDLSEIMHAI